MTSQTAIQNCDHPGRGDPIVRRGLGVALETFSRPGLDGVTPPAPAQAPRANRPASGCYFGDNRYVPDTQ